MSQNDPSPVRGRIELLDVWRATAVLVMIGWHLCWDLGMLGVFPLSRMTEPLAVGVARAAEQMGLSGRVRVVGFDTNVQCVDLMRSGTVSALIAQNPYAMGYLGVETAWQLLEGQNFDPDRLIDTATTIISADNMFTIESQKAMFSFG